MKRFTVHVRIAPPLPSVSLTGLHSVTVQSLWTVVYMGRFLSVESFLRSCDRGFYTILVCFVVIVFVLGV